MKHQEFKLALKVLQSYIRDEYKELYGEFQEAYESWSEEDHKDFASRFEDWNSKGKDYDEESTIYEFHIVEAFLLAQIHEGLSQMAAEAKHHSKNPEDCDYSIAAKFLSMYGRDHLPKHVTYGAGGEKLVKGIGGQYYLKTGGDSVGKIYYYFSDKGELMAEDGVRLFPVQCTSVECPECMGKVEQEELYVFGGLCEDCTAGC